MHEKLRIAPEAKEQRIGYASQLPSKAVRGGPPICEEGVVAMDCIVGGHDVYNRKWFDLPDWPVSHPTYADYGRQNQAIADSGDTGDRILQKRPMKRPTLQYFGIQPTK